MSVSRSAARQQLAAANELLRALPWRREVKDVESDGACLFRALADQVHGTQGAHREVRMACCNFIESNSDFHGAIEGDLTPYLTNMRRDETWGGELEIAAAAAMWGKVVVVDPSVRTGERFRFWGDGHGQARFVIVAWRGADGQVKHYSSTTPMKLA